MGFGDQVFRWSCLFNEWREFKWAHAWWVDSSKESLRPNANSVIGTSSSPSIGLVHENIMVDDRNALAPNSGPESTSKWTRICRPPYLGVSSTTWNGVGKRTTSKKGKVKVSMHVEGSKFWLLDEQSSPENSVKNLAGFDISNDYCPVVVAFKQPLREI